MNDPEGPSKNLWPGLQNLENVRLSPKSLRIEKIFDPSLGYAMQMQTLLVIVESAAFHGEITCTTGTIYIMDQMHLVIISSICVHFVEWSIWPIEFGKIYHKQSM